MIARPKAQQFATKNWPSQKEPIVSQPSIFRGELLVSGSVWEEEVA